jgi:SynChlorMet cassette protein ScmC
MESYTLQLGDESKWRFCASHEVMCWLTDFASILMLDSSDRHVEKETASPGFREVHKKDYGLPEDDFRISFLQAPPGRFEHNRFIDVVQSSINNGQRDYKFGIKRKDGHEKFLVMNQALGPIFRESIIKGGLPFHGALAELDGKGVIFAAPGNTGKSTCYRRLPSYWNALCDDLSLVVLEPSTGNYRAHPMPTWSKYSFREVKEIDHRWDIQHHVKLSAIFFLQRRDTDEIVPMNPVEAAMMINGSANQATCAFHKELSMIKNKEDRIQQFDNACKMAKTIPAYALRLTKDGNFWELVEQVIK